MGGQASARFCQVLLAILIESKHICPVDIHELRAVKPVVQKQAHSPVLRTAILSQNHQTTRHSEESVTRSHYCVSSNLIHGKCLYLARLIKWVGE